VNGQAYGTAAGHTLARGQLKREHIVRQCSCRRDSTFH
jgi:hypothetical protein